MIPVILGVLLIVFTISYLTPGDPAATVLGRDFTQEQYEAQLAKMGLDKPFIVQFYNYVKNLVTKFDLGTSYLTGRTVADEVIYRFPTTLKLGLISVVVTVLLGIPLGILSATRQYSILDYTVTSMALIIAAIPNFVLSLFAIILFALKLSWLPVSGVDTWQGWILPVASNSLGIVAILARLTRTSMLEVVRQDYIRTARAKGLKENIVTYRHALPNALIPIVTVIGSQMAFVMAGSVIVETIFNIPGMGMYMMSGINGRDYPVINGTVVILTLIICVMNLLVDIVYAYIDPRIKALYMSGRKKPKRVNSAAHTEMEGS